MAYDYLGTMDRDQFDDLVAFARKQKTLVGWQDDHAKAEIKRLDSFLAKLLKAHDVFFGGTLGAGQTLPTFRDREIFEEWDPDTEEGGAELDMDAPANEPFLAHAGREDAFRLGPLPLKIAPIDVRTARNDWESAEVARSIKAPFLPAFKHQREQLEWRVRKVQDRQEQLEESRRRRRVAKDTATEIFVADLERMFSGALEPNSAYWWSLNPQPGSTAQDRPEAIFRRDRYSQAQKELRQASQKAVESNKLLNEGK